MTLIWVNFFFNATGHFPWLFESRLIKYLISHSEGGRATAYIKKVTLDLIGARRESEHGDKVAVFHSSLSVQKLSEFTLFPGPILILLARLSYTVKRH